MASSCSIASAAFSTSATTSPISRIRLAILAGSNASSASNFSPTPANLIGQPVICRIDNAAPPLASPSSLVKIMPEIPILDLKAVAVFTASCPVNASATSSVSAGFETDFIATSSSIKPSSIDCRPAVSKIKTSYP